MKNFLSMAALALVGAVMTGCTNDDNIIDEPQQPASKSNVVTLTTTVSLDGGAQTRALTSGGVKTFAVGETMAIYYWKNKGNDREKAVSAPLTAGDITNGGKSATFTFTLDNPYKDQNVHYIYPAAMANADFTPNYDALYNNQDGTLATLASNFDFCTKSGAWNGDNLPSLTLENQLAILALTLKNSTGSSTITSGLTQVTVSDGTNTYTVRPTSSTFGTDVIYVAIRPTSSANISVTATTGTTNYTKSLTGKTYAAGNGYSVSWKMTEAVPEGVISGKFTINGSGTQVYFSKGNLQATYDGTDWTWAFAANQWDYIGANEGNTKVSATSPFVSDYSGSSTTVDLFGWVGASSTWTDVAQYGITSSITTNNTNGYGNVANEALKSDWGTLMGSGWRTLTSAEWKRVFNNRTASTVNGTANARYAKATVAGKTGIILFPDSYTHPSDVTQPTSINTANAAFTVNSYDATAWGKMETAGAVFLPAAGYRFLSVNYAGTIGRYWSSRPHESDVNGAYNVSFDESNLTPDIYSSRDTGYSVRLVRQVE